MIQFQKILQKTTLVAATVACIIALVPTGSAAAATATQIKEAQTIANKFGMQVGAADGVFGPKTARGFCMFRYISGLTPSRAGLDTALLSKLRAYNTRYSSLRAIPSPAGTYLVAHEKCQMMVYATGGKYRAVTPISTGMSGFGTPNGTYALGGTLRGWSCSTLYPESCRTQSVGRFAYISNYGNMYNKRHIVGGVKLHGSTSVPTYPASHGCIRVPVSFSDWMYDNVNANIPIKIVGAY
ncbi:MAG TPA: L,D-transpeptidase [Candidatus Limnocylindrales bacterium]|nr:L,D-transpeptidase [Candidatus Limnocylindrales bacterium]